MNRILSLIFLFTIAVQLASGQDLPTPPECEGVRKAAESQTKDTFDWILSNICKKYSINIHMAYKFKPILDKWVDNAADKMKALGSPFPIDVRVVVDEFIEKCFKGSKIISTAPNLCTLKEDDLSLAPCITEVFSPNIPTFLDYAPVACKKVDEAGLLPKIFQGTEISVGWRDVVMKFCEENCKKL